MKVRLRESAIERDTNWVGQLERLCEHDWSSEWREEVSTWEMVSCHGQVVSCTSMITWIKAMTLFSSTSDLIFIKFDFNLIKQKPSFYSQRTLLGLCCWEEA